MRSRRQAAIAELRGLLAEGIAIGRDFKLEGASAATIVAFAGHVGRCEALQAIIASMEAQTDEEWEIAHPAPITH